MIKRNTIITVILISSIFLSGCFALAEPEESSGTVSAPTIAAVGEALEPAEDATAVVPTDKDSAPVTVERAEKSTSDEAYPAQETLPTPAPPETSKAYPGGQPTAVPIVVPLPKEYPGAEGVGEIVGETAVYEIDPAKSEARFWIDEVLRGADKTVVGVSDNLGGQIVLDLNNPGSAQIGTILINARDFVTDSDFRNRAIANKILLTNEYEFITFEPTAISGLPAAIVVGETYPLQITGDLTITDQTREVTFDAEVTPRSENELVGLAKLDILYADFGLVIPLSQSVQAVEDNVLLELDFVANRQ